MKTGRGLDVNVAKGVDFDIKSKNILDNFNANSKVKTHV